MQMLCRIDKHFFRSSLLAGFAALLWMSSPSSWSAGASTSEQLYSQIRQWEAQERHMRPEQIEVGELDYRVQVLPCAYPLSMDHPFASQETVRVRCLGAHASSPQWQLYLQVSAAKPTSAPANIEPTTVTRQVLVAKQLIPHGVKLDASMLQEVTQTVSRQDNQLLKSAKDVELAEVVRDISPGSVLHSYDVRRSVLVKQGQSAMLSIGSSNTFQVTVQAEAQQDGFMGDQIRLKNAESGRILYGVVTGPNALRGL